MEFFKKKILSFLIFLFCISFNLSAVEHAPASSSLEVQLEQLVSEENETNRLHRLFDLYWDWSIAEVPENATFYGCPGKHDQWSDLSPEALLKSHEFSNKLLNTLNHISLNSLKNEEDQISYKIFKRMLEEDLESSKFFDQYLLVNQMFGIQIEIPAVLEIMPTNSVEDYENILSRLRHLPLVYEQTIALLKEGIKAGITQPRIAIQGVPQQIFSQIAENSLDSPLLISFRQFPSSMDVETQLRLLTEAKDIYQKVLVPSLKQFHHFISEEYLPNCRESIGFCDLPNGYKWYAHKVKSTINTDLTPEEIHSIGIKEVNRIHQEMVELISHIGFKGSFEEFLKFLSTDEQFYFSSREEILESYRTLTRDIESKLPLLFSELPKLPFEVIPVPAYSEEAQIAAYYLPGSIREKRPGYFFINTSHPEKRSKLETVPLALHEAVPGHHLQTSLAQELKDLPEFRKHVHFTSYIEGWGLYSESLGFELGLYEDPYSYFGRLCCEMLRAIRLVVDTGMHSMGWSRDQAIDFFKQNVAMTDHEILMEVDRYLVLPGQALAYKIGELKIKELRQLSSLVLKNNFDVRAFHQAWLKHGTLPLDIAEEQILQWLEQTKSEIKQSA